MQALLDLLSALEGSVSEAAELLGYNSPLNNIKIQSKCLLPNEVIVCQIINYLYYKSGHALIEFAVIFRVANL